MNIRRKGYNIKVSPSEHILATWLRKAGHTRGFLKSYFDISRDRLRLGLIKPHQVFTFHQLLMISGLVQRPFIEVLFTLFPSGVLRKEVTKWYSDTGLDVDYIPDVED